MNRNPLTSPEMNRQMGKATDNGLKFFFKWFGIAVTELVKFIKVLVSSAMGK